MARKKLKSGDILSIPLPRNLGFAFAKYIDLLSINPNSSYPDLIRVYDYKSKDQALDINDLKDCDLLLAPLLVGSLRPTVSKGIWTIVGNATITDQETKLPHYRTFGPPWINDEKEAKEWFYVVDADISRKIKSKYDHVKHLEPLGASGTGIIELEIAFAFLIKEGKRIEDFFPLTKQMEKATYKKMMERPKYRDMSKEMRDKAIT